MEFVPKHYAYDFVESPDGRYRRNISSQNPRTEEAFAAIGDLLRVPRAVPMSLCKEILIEHGFAQTVGASVTLGRSRLTSYLGMSIRWRMYRHMFILTDAKVEDSQTDFDQVKANLDAAFQRRRESQ